MEKLHASSDSHRHGLLAKCVLLDHENPETFALLHQQYIDRINPSDGIEITLVEDLAATVWRQRRLWRIERNLLSEAMQKRPEAAGNRLTGAFSDLSRGPELILIDRQESRLHRSFHRTLKNIQLLRQIELPNEPNSDQLDLESAIYPTTSEEQTTPATQTADALCGAHAPCAVFTPGEHLDPQNSKLPNEPKSPQSTTKQPTYPQTFTTAAGGADFSLLPTGPAVPPPPDATEIQDKPSSKFQPHSALDLSPVPAAPPQPTTSITTEIQELPNEPRSEQPPSKSVLYPPTSTPKFEPISDPVFMVDPRTGQLRRIA